MEVLVSLALVVLFLAASPSSSSAAAAAGSGRGGNGNRIVGGEEAVAGQLPYHVAIVGMDGGGVPVTLCSGTILGPWSVLTTATCCLKKNKYSPDVYVFAGDTNIEDAMATGQQLVRILGYTRHPFWDESQPHDNNLCLAFLSSDFLTWVGDSNVAIAPLIDSAPTDGEVCTVAGWGQTDDSDPDSLSEDLMATQVVIQADAMCDEAHGGDFVSERMLCATSGPCAGDEGGALACSNGRLAGVVVGAGGGGGGGCGQGPTYYADVQKYRTWIESNGVSITDESDYVDDDGDGNIVNASVFALVIGLCFLTTVFS